MSISLSKYKEFIEGLLPLRESVNSRLVREGGFRSTSSNAKYNELIESLSSGQRESLSELITQERSGSIHDVLVYLTDREYRLTHDGEQVAHEPFGTESYFDFVARSAGDSWPDER